MIGKIMFKNIFVIGSILATLTGSSLVFAAQKTVTLDVPGMTCSSCPITVKKAVMKVDGVQQAEVNYESREAVVTFDDSTASLDKIQLATANAGYPSTVKAGK
jgi:mercuric ion binding protein